MSKIAQLCMLSIALISSSVVADIRPEMRQFGGLVSQISRADSLEDFQKHITELRALAIQARAKTPTKITNERDLKDFQAGMERFIAVLDRALAVAQQGDLNGAKSILQEAFALRNEYHRKYK